MSQGPLCPNLTPKFPAEVSQMANRNLSCVILLGGLSVNLNHLKTGNKIDNCQRRPYEFKFVFHINCPPLLLQGLFVPFARVRSGDPVRVLHLFHDKYSGYCCIHLLCKAMYNLSLPRLSATYYGLATTVQLWAAHESRCSLFSVSRSTARVLYCTYLEWHIFGTVHSVNLLLTAEEGRPWPEILL